MATRAIEDLKFALIKRYKVKNGTTLNPDDRVKFGTTDDEVDVAAAADDLAFGTVRGSAAAVGNAGGTVTVDVVLDFFAIKAMTVGTGGSTRGKRQKTVADGVTDAAAAGVAAASVIVGVAMQTGVAGDKIGVGLASCRVTTA
jgi:hypothetical protein